MSLDKARLRTRLTALMEKTTTSNGSEAEAEQEFVNDWSDAIEEYVKGAKINYIGGLAAGATPVGGTFSGSLS